MRLYSITNMYTSGIHAGIQTAHALHEMFRDHSLTALQRSVLNDWADNHKTIIVLNGGYHAEIESVAYRLYTLGHRAGLPVGYFRESEEALAGAYTAAVIVVPEHIYNAYPETASYTLSDNDLEIYNIIKKYPLAK